jgi:hypothetical protein
MKTLQNLEVKGSKCIALAIFLCMSLASQAEDNVSKALYKDFTGTGTIGFYIIGGIIVGGLILHIIVNHIIKPKEDENDHKISGIPHHHHHRHHHHPHRVIKKTS